MNSATKSKQQLNKNQKATKYRSSVMKSVHKTIEDLHRIGLVDNQTMREFDETCLTPVIDFTPYKVKKLRQKEKVSQAVFAEYLNVSSTVVSQWERGIKKPGPTAAKLLSLVEKNGLQSIA